MPETIETDRRAPTISNLTVPRQAFLIEGDRSLGVVLIGRKVSEITEGDGGVTWRTQAAGNGEAFFVERDGPPVSFRACAAIARPLSATTVARSSPCSRASARLSSYSAADR